jgi:hypothetical protein
MRYYSLVIAFSLLMIVGCGPSKELLLPLKYVNKSTQSKQAISECHSTLYLYDTRKIKTMGQMSGQPVLAKSGVKDWLKSAAHKELGESLDFEWAEPSTYQPHQWGLELKKVYVMNQTTNMAATTVFLLRNTESGFKRVYRGNVTHSNWNSGYAETMTVLNASVKEVFAKMRTDIRRLCQA